MITHSTNVIRTSLMAFGATLIFIIFALALILILNEIEPDPSQVAQNVMTSALSEGINIIDPPQEISDFSMQSAVKGVLRLSDFRGKYVLIAFGYTHCPDVCPATLLDFKQVKRDLGEQAKNVDFIFISFDEERDTPEVINRYVAGFDEKFIGLSGTSNDFDVIGAEFNLFYSVRENPGSNIGYLVDHSASRFLVSPQGQLIRTYAFTTDVEAIVIDLQQLF